MKEVEIRVLGSLEVVDVGRTIEVRRPRERSLLTLLACEPGRVVSADRLIDGLWGETPPATAAKTLQTYVHHLRSLLPDGTIVTEPAGYRLAVAPDDIDMFRFLAVVDDAKRVLAEDPESGATALSGALTLWRGRPAVDAEDAAWIRPLVSRLEDERLQATASLMEAKIDSGHHEAVVPELRSLLDENYLREDLWGLYMLALYRSGRQAEALRAYAEARHRLAGELGIEPGPQLQRLEDQILAHDPTLLPEAPPLEPVAPAGEPERERPTPPEQRLVTLLRAELLGMEGLRDTVGEEGYVHARAEAMATMALTVKRFGGTVFTDAGVGVAAVFGAPVAREDDCYRAIRTALRLTAEIAEHSREIERSWGVAGVAARTAVYTLSLTVSFDGTSDLAEAVGPVQRLLSVGPAGSVVVDDHTRNLMGDLFEWVAVTEPADGPAWLVRKVLGGADKARMGRRLHAPLTGRERELASATARLTAVGKGVGGILLISGEAGVGKTRLVEEARVRPAARAVTWMAGHSVSYAEATPYWPFRDLVRSWIGVGIDDTDLQARMALHRRLEESLPEAAAELYPYLGGVLGITLEPDQAQRLQLASEALQYRTFEVISATVAGLAEKEPVVMVFEDVHWADSTSVQLLDQLLPLTDTHAVVIALTTRPGPDHPSRRLAESARQRFPHRTSEIVLDVLTGDAQRAMLHSLIGSDALPPPVADHILSLAEGNPFYLEELVGSLIDQGALVPSTSGWELHDAPLTVPETVEKVVQARIDSLDRSARELLTAAAILGRSFGLPLLQGVVGESGAPIEVVHDLLRLDLLVEARRWPQAEYLFRHALIQEAAYRTLAEERRVELHRRAAEWLERRYQHNQNEVMGLLAGHWKAAGDDDKAVTALIRAGDLARRDHALDEAIDHYRELLPILERRRDRRTMALVLLKLGLALHTALRFAESNATYRRAFDLWEPEPSPKPTATIRFCGPPFVSVPDPVRSFFLQDMQLQMALFDRLVERWPDDTLVPSLAETWEISEDGLTYRFHLREGLEWSDGHPLTAGDVEYGVLRNLDRDRPGVGVAMFYVLEGALDHMRGRNPDGIGVTALDDRTVEFRLVNPAPYFLAMLNRPDAGPQPRHAIQSRGEEWGAVEHEVVSGAFRRRAHSKDRVVLERRPDYGGARRGNVEVVEWTQGTPGETVDRYVENQVDLAWITSVWVGEGLERIPEEQHRFAPPAGLTYLAFIFDHDAVSDARLRRALALTIDRRALSDVLPSRSTPATGGIVPPALAGHTPDIAPRFDPELSRELVFSSQVSRPLRVACPLSADYHFERLVRASVEAWRRHLPLEIELVGLDYLAYRELLADPTGFDLLTATWYPGYTDPEYYLRLLLHSEASANCGSYASEPYDELVERACAARDERTRLALFHEADRLAVAEEAAVIPLSYDRSVSLRRPGVEGWWEYGKSWANFADLTVTDPLRSGGVPGARAAVSAGYD